MCTTRGGEPGGPVGGGRAEAPAALGDQAWFRQLVGRANAGDREALAALRRFLDEHPEVWRRAGDLTAAAEGAWTALLAGANALAAESVARSVAALKGGLAGPGPTALESLLVDQVALCWLAARHAEVHAADPSETSPSQAALRLRRAESAQRRLLGAARALATLRALVPAGLATPSAPRLHDPARQAV